MAARVNYRCLGGKGVLLCCVSLCVVLLQSVACAELLPPTLSNDSHAMNGWHGFRDLSSVGAAVRIEYAVYAPGDFVKTFTNWVDPTNGTSYVYAYQMFNQGTSSDNLRKLTVNADVNINLVANANEISWPGTSSPRVSTVQSATSVVWTWDTANRIYGGGTNSYSNVLFFTSRYAPEWAIASIQYTLGRAYSVPGGLPIPEPSSLIGLAGGGGVLVIRRYWNRFRCLSS
jgi:hypothetical protein